MAFYRKNINLTGEIEDLLIADAALTIAFAVLLSGALRGNGPGGFLYYLPIAFIAASLSFILHEYMHKIVAQRFGAIAGFRRSDLGIIITLFSSLVGFLIGLPGATMIYTNSFTKKENGYVSLAGPLTNLAIFAVFFIVGSLLPIGANRYAGAAISVTLFISLWLAFFNMLPISPLDGSKVLAWDARVYVVVMAAILAPLFIVFGPAIIYDVAYVFIIAMIISLFSRGVLFRM